MCRALPLLLLSVYAAAQDRTPEDEQEARAQQALADSLTDAMAMMEHGSDSAKESAALGIAQMAVETTISQPFHPVTFRNACVKAGVIERLIKLLDPVSGSTPAAQNHALNALEAIATDDPTTDLDNGHAQRICSLGACPHVVRLLSSQQEWMQAGPPPRRHRRHLGHRHDRTQPAHAASARRHRCRGRPRL